MVFTSVQKNKIKNHIHSNPEHKSICPMCHKDDWLISDEEILVQIEDKKIVDTTVICKNCGLILHYRIAYEILK